MNNFSDFLDDFKSKNPKDDFKRNLNSIVKEIKDVISGIKSLLISPSQKASPSERAVNVVKEAEKFEDFNIEKDADFKDIKGILNAIENNTSRQLQSFTNSDNFQNPLEIESKNSKIEIDLDKKMFEMAKEQLSIVKEIRDVLKPKIPPELEEQKAKKIDVLEGLFPESPLPKVPPIADMIRKDKNSPVIVSNGEKGETKTKPKTSKLKTMGKLGLGALGIAGAAYFAKDTVDQLNNEYLKDLMTEVDDDLKAGKITEKEANAKKEQIVTEHKKEVNKVIFEEGGNIAGGLTGAALGAKLGSFLGPVGTLGGGIMGGVTGSFMGSDLGKKASEYFENKNMDDFIGDVKSKSSQYLDVANEKFEQAKDYVKTDLFPDASKKVEGFMNSVRENLSLDNIREKTARGLEAIKEVIEPEKSSIMSKMTGDKPGDFISKLTEEPKSSNPIENAKSYVNNIINNQSTNTFIPMPSKPRADSTGSALDKYTDRISSF